MFVVIVRDFLFDPFKIESEGSYLLRLSIVPIHEVNRYERFFSRIFCIEQDFWIFIIKKM